MKKKDILFDEKITRKSVSVSRKKTPEKHPTNTQYVCFFSAPIKIPGRKIRPASIWGQPSTGPIPDFKKIKTKKR